MPSLAAVDSFSPLVHTETRHIMASRIPSEMRDHICGFLPIDQKSDLKAASLVSRDWHASAHRGLWRQVTFFVNDIPVTRSDDPVITAVLALWAQMTSERPEADKCRTLGELQAFFQEHPDVSQHVRTLELRFHAHYSMDGPKPCKVDLLDLLRVLNALPNLKRLVVLNCAPTESIDTQAWQDHSVVPVNLRELHYVFDTAGLRSSNVNIGPAILRFLGMFANVDTLEVHKSHDLGQDLVIAAPPALAPADPQHLLLKSLRICSCLHDSDSHLVATLAPLARSVSSLAFGFVKISEQCQTLINTSGLTSLTVTALNSWDVFTGRAGCMNPRLDISRVPALETLHIRNFCSFRSETGPWPPLRQTFCSLLTSPSFNTVRRIVLEPTAKIPTLADFADHLGVTVEDPGVMTCFDTIFGFMAADAHTPAATPTLDAIDDVLLQLHTRGALREIVIVCDDPAHPFLTASQKMFPQSFRTGIWVHKQFVDYVPILDCDL